MERKIEIATAGDSGELTLQRDSAVEVGAPGRAKLIFVGMTTHIVTVSQKMDDGTILPVLKISGPVLCEVIDTPDGGTYVVGIDESDPCPSALTIYVRQ
jgi:hypothetical protein